MWTAKGVWEPYKETSHPSPKGCIMPNEKLQCRTLTAESNQKSNNNPPIIGIYLFHFALFISFFSEELPPKHCGAIGQLHADYQQMDLNCSPPKINFSRARSSFNWRLWLDQLNELMERQWEAAVEWAASGRLHSASSGSQIISFYLDTSYLTQLQPLHFPSQPSNHSGKQLTWDT